MGLVCLTAKVCSRYNAQLLNVKAVPLLHIWVFHMHHIFLQTCPQMQQGGTHCNAQTSIELTQLQTPVVRQVCLCLRDASALSVTSSVKLAKCTTKMIVLIYLLLLA